MYIIKFFQYTFIIFSFVLMTACSDTTSSTTASGIPQEKAIEKIVSFVSGNTISPRISDYENAGIYGVNAENIALLNQNLKKYTIEEVDTPEEIQAIVNYLATGGLDNGEDNIKPVITILGDNPVVLDVNDTYTDFGATAMDNVDGDISRDIQVAANFRDTSREGNYTITYRVSDRAGNSAEAIRRIEIHKPTISIPVAKKVTINEVLAGNAYSNVDADYSKFSDWIELYNSENSQVDVGGFYLSDDASEVKKWQIPTGTVIEAKGYLLIWADDKDSKKNDLHTNFKLSAKGETVILSDKNGVMMDSMTFGKQTTDISCRAQADGSIVFMNPTPGKLNSMIHTTNDRSDKPVITGTQTVTITAAPGSTIYYTKDGSTPTANSFRYSGPISISSTTVIRASALESGKFLSESSSKSFFVNHTTSLPIVSLITDDKYLYDNKIGIYKNYEQDWKRPVHLEFLDSNHQEKFATGMEFEISGQSSRSRQKKSFKCEFDKDYGMKSLKSTTYQLYPSKNLSKIKDFKIRAGDHGYRIGDILAAVIVEDGNLSVDYQAYRTVEMFMNGKLWGVYNIRETKGIDYILSNYPNIDEEKLDIINNNGPVVKAGTYDDYAELRDAAREYDNYQQVLDMIDEESFIDYMIVMLYSGNQDWIWANSRAWKEKKPGAKWRWMLDDVDEGFNKDVINNDNFEMLTRDTHRSALANTYMTLIKNSTFKTKFKARFNTLLDTLLSPAHMHTLIDKIIDERKDLITKGKYGISQSTFDSYVQGLYDFADQREAVVRGQLNAL